MILTDDEIRKAAEFAAEQMWPESGYVGWTEDDAVFHRKFIEACFEKLRGGVELPEPFGLFCGVRHDPPKTKEFWGMLNGNAAQETKCDIFTRDQVNTLLAARALAAREQAIEEWRVHLLALWEKGDFDLKDAIKETYSALAASPQEQT